MSDYNHDWIPCIVDTCIIIGGHWHCQSYYPQHPNCSAIRRYRGEYPDSLVVGEWRTKQLLNVRKYPTYNQRRYHEINTLDYIRTGRINDCIPEAYGYRSKKHAGMAGYDNEGRELKTGCSHRIPTKELTEVRSNYGKE